MSEKEELNRITQAIIGAQLLSYLKLTRCKAGLLINFNVQKLVNGIIRVVNNFPD
jgi:GxxExxY protein